MRVRVAPTLLACASIAGLVGCGGSGSSSGTLPTPVISSITPNPATRGSAITITGMNLGGPLVSIDFVQGTNQQTVVSTAGSSTTVVASVPNSLNAGTVDIHVVTSAGSSERSASSNTATISIN